MPSKVGVLSSGWSEKVWPQACACFLFPFLAVLQACEILVPGSGIEPVPPALAALSPNHLDHQGSPHF